MRKLSQRDVPLTSDGRPGFDPYITQMFEPPRSQFYTWSYKKIQKLALSWNGLIGEVKTGHVTDLIA